MPRKHFTARSINSWKPPSSGQVDYWDEDTPGFGLRLSAGGRRTWIVMYRLGRRKVRLTLGTFPEMPLVDAKQEARNAISRVQKGKDPAAEKRAERDAESFGQLAYAYLEKYAKVRKKSWKTDDEVLKRDVLPRWKHRPAKDITRRDVRDLLDVILKRGAPIMANRTFEILRRLFNWAITEDYLTSSPCTKLPKPSKERRRDRVLNDDEIRAVWKAIEVEKPLVVGIFKLRLITAQRGGEVMSMAWGDVDEGEGWWTIPAERAKNGLSHRVPLTDLASAVLDEVKRFGNGSPWVFPSQRRGRHLEQMVQAAYRIRDRSGVDFVPHDLRRTAASCMTGMGISRLTVSKILNHAERGVTATYDRHSYDPEKRQALEAWALRLKEVVAGKKSSERKVVQFIAARS
jgi:integrase